MTRVLRIGAALVATTILLAPAIWNRFPLLQWDTGGYLARWYEGYLVPSRSTVYGLFITALAHPDFWLVVIAQSAITVWVLALLLRTFGLGGRPLALLGVSALLAVLTTLPWLTSILLTDIFAVLAVLALHLLIFHAALLHRPERYGLIALIAFSVATHSATFAVLVALVIAAAAARSLFNMGSARGIARGAAAVVLGAGLLLAGNYVTSGRVAWTPGGISLAFGRMLQDGIVVRYLDEHCPDKRLRLCAYRNELPRNADVFFWGGDSTVFNRLGRFAGLGDEMGLIVVESLRAYPAWQFEMAVAATASQLVRVATGEGVLNQIWHTYAIVEKFKPSIVPQMRAARQQHGEIGFDAINTLHRPVALGSMLLLIGIAWLGLRREVYADLGMLATTALVALLANAVVCGVLSNPHDRYGARLAWIAPLIVVLAAHRLYAERRSLIAAWRRGMQPLAADRAPPA